MDRRDLRHLPKKSFILGRPWGNKVGSHGGWRIHLGKKEHTHVAEEKKVSRSITRDVIEAAVRKAGFKAEKAAVLYGVSLRQFERLVRSLTGKTVIQLCRELRCDGLKAELAAGVKNSEVARGKFASPQYFAHVFKKVYGISPRQFARREQQRRNGLGA